MHMMYPENKNVIVLALCMTTCLLSWYLAAVCHASLPAARNVTGEFNPYLAKKTLQKLTGFGPRPAGSYANDVQAVAMLTEEIKKINSSSLGKIQLEMDIQKASGSFQLNVFDAGLTHKYADLLNVVARLSEKKSGKIDHQNRSAILVNAHFDSVPQGPGAGDDGANCAVMLEAIRLLVTESSPDLKNDLVFLFNGAEESFLPASHAFITQHPWATNLKAFLNLEGAGTGGRELLFQSGPENPWLIQKYIEHAPHPFATIIGQEIFQSGLIPSDTDFRIFRDYGHIPGLDVAFIKNGYVYHTENDKADRLPIETLQRVGDNVYSVMKALATSDSLGADSSNTTQVFFDVFGLFMVSYPQWAGILLNSLMIAAAVISCWLNFFALAKKTDVPAKRLWFFLAVSTTSNLFILLLSVLMSYLISLLLGSSGCAMSWFSRPSLLLGVYAAPSLGMGTSIMLMFSSYLERKLSVKDEKNTISSMTWFHAINIFFSLPCLVLTVTGYNSGFVFSMSLMFMLVSLSISSLQKMPSAIICCLGMGNKKWSRLSLHLLVNIIPLMMWSYLIQLVFTIFIPIMGRNGTTRNPDMTIGIATAVFTFILLQPFLPLFASFKRKFLGILSISYFVSTLVILIMLTMGKPSNFGFPYSGASSSPAQKRILVYHVSRLLPGSKKSDGGFLFARMDYHETQKLLDIQEYSDAEIVDENLCKSLLACGIPVFSRKLPSLEGSRWFPSSPPTFHTDPLSIDVISRASTGPGLTNLTLQISGSVTSSTLVFAPVQGVKLTEWNLSRDILPSSSWNEKDTYHVSINRGLNPKPAVIWLLLHEDDTSSVSKESLLDIALTGHHHHGQEMSNGLLESVKSKFPSWVSLSAWTVEHIVTSF